MGDEPRLSAENASEELPIDLGLTPKDGRVTPAVEDTLSFAHASTTLLQGADTADLRPSWANSALAAWLADHGGKERPAADFFSDLCARLIEEGVPLSRAMVAMTDNHPQIAARAIFWHQDRPAEEEAFPRSEVKSEQYLNSPVRLIHEGASGVRRRLDTQTPLLDFPILNDLVAEGATDYVAMPLAYSDGSRHFISWVTRQPGGFTTRQLRKLYELMPLICLRLELDHSYLVRDQFLRTYLGARAAERVIGGTIQRNQVETLNAIILYNDLRSFTHLTDTLEPDQVIQVLAEYYEAVARPIDYFGGDIIKMMGDGMLSIFPLEADMSKERRDRVACGAVAAAKRAIKGLGAIAPERLPPGVDRLRAGFALHAGTVIFGNVGSAERLDFTVIGPAVNEAQRVEELTKTLGHPVLTTAAFADLKCNVQLESLGRHELRGVRERKELFRVVEVDPNA